MSREPYLLKKSVIEGLDAGVRDLVVWLSAQGFRTCDSGDGSKAATMECAVPFSMIVITTVPALLIADSHKLYRMLKERGVSFAEPKDAHPGVSSMFIRPQIQASYDPYDEIATIQLFNVLSKDVRLT